MDTQLYCPNETRKQFVRAGGTLNGIDFLEVLDDDAPPGSPRQRTLLLHCLRPLADLTERNTLITGGVRIRAIDVQWARPAGAVAGLLNADERAYLAQLPSPERVLVIRTDRAGDFSPYTLHLVLSPTRLDEPPTGFDDLLSAVEFSFKVDCPSEFDCDPQRPAPPPDPETSRVEYLAKDYASFRRLMLDRLAAAMPAWRERNPADLGVALVETLAYAADHLSYFQDAVATEAYLGTARRRASVRRHARLVDYFMHDGANARVWVVFEVTPGGAADGATLPGPRTQPQRRPGVLLLSREAGAQTALTPAQGAAAIARGALAFETLHDVTLRAGRNAIPFYTWGDPRCFLPSGATRATLAGSAPALDLHRGDVLIFEEVLGLAAGRPEDASAAAWRPEHADISHRHAVRLDEEPRPRTDPLTGTPVLEIHWGTSDALPFPLRLWQFDDGLDGDGRPRVRHVSLARGNVALADHGWTVPSEPLVPARVPAGRRFRPTLRRTGVTQAMPYLNATARGNPAAAATAVDLRRVRPCIVLEGDDETWLPQRDLLNSDRFAPEFVLELEADGRAQLRFGDGVVGRRPAEGAIFRASYRLGSGQAGNVGPESLSRIVADDRIRTFAPGIAALRNPLSAAGGTEPETVEQVRLYAPQAFRTQQRAVTVEDYATVAQRHPEVQRAAATRRWTGSWYTVFLTVDRRGGRPVDRPFEAALRSFLEPLRLAGHDLEIDGPRFVPLDVVLTVCLRPGYERSTVKQSLLETFGNADLPDGRRGFFHPDNFTFGQPVYLSQVIAAAMQVSGVHWVDSDDTPPRPNRFQRWGQLSRGEAAAGRIVLGRLEIARLDNDPNQPENGRIEFHMRGGS